ncbi:DedA family protein [Thermohalobacter berrensis]|uniref:VTT domain-containing protein n=1 Tax=Thermohalobacter berrensis TaxID=99594 RepID=A0A419T9W4_9FIRM|nr:DedA family protein [Thermohalobacter berrensis]RKD34269.1 hypothetical protein BET03_00095 [Thermohalobacter berrensis]
METIIVELARSLVENNKILSFFFFFISQSLQVLFPPYPGDMVLILEGYLSGIAEINIVLVSLNAILATFLSSILLYHIGKKEQEKILKSKIINYLFDTAKVDKLRNLFDNYGPVAIIASKFIPGIYSVTILAAGIFQVPKRIAYISIAVITALHHILLIYLGNLVGENWKVILYKIEAYNKYVIILAVLGILIYGLLILIKNKLFQE